MIFKKKMKEIYRDIERDMLFVPAYFFCTHPRFRAPLRILVSNYGRRKRGFLRRELQRRGFKVRFWKAG